MSHSEPSRFNILAYRAVFTLIVVAFGFILIVFPKSYDDWWYWGEWIHYGNDLNGHHSLPIGWLESLKYHWNYDNVRLCNIVIAPLLQLHHWVLGVICALCFGWGFWLMTKVTATRPGRLARLVLLSLLIVFPSIWQEAMFSKVYAFNYICVLPIFFGAIHLFIREKPVRMIWAFLLGLLLGAWQEGYALPALGGGIIVLLVHPRMVSRWRIAMLVGIALGILWLILPPALWSRFGEQKSFNPSRIVYLVLLFVFLAVWLLSVFLRRWRQIALSPLCLITLVACVGLPVLVAHTALVRAAFAAIVLSACALTVYASARWPRTFADRTVFSRVFSAVGTAVLAVHLVAVCAETVTMRRIIDTINEKYFLIRQHDGYFFAPMRYVWNSSPLTLGRPDIDMCYPTSINMVFPKYVSDNLNLIPIPEELEFYERGMGEPLPGNSESRLWKGHIISPNLADTVNSYTDTRYGNRLVTAPTVFTPFTTASGDTFVYILPDRPVYAIYAGDPKEIYLKTDL